MQIDTQRFLDYVEQTGKLCFWDIEATGLRGDYNSVLCVSIKPWGGDVTTFTIKQPGNDQKVVRQAAELLAEYDCWAGYYSKGFDKPMLNTRLLKWGAKPLVPRHHIDLYYQCKSHLLTARRSQGHLLSWLGTPEQKMTVGADTWNDVLYNTKEAMETMVERCESDVIGLEGLYNKVRHVIKDIKRD